MPRRSPSRFRRHSRTRPPRARRDAEPSCAIRLYVGAGVPGPAGRYQELPLEFDPAAFRATVERLVSDVFPNATFFRTRGVWQGGSEDGIMVEVLAAPENGSCRVVFERAETVARRLARQLGQDAVLVVATDARGNRIQDLVTRAA